ncbi:hypothetical protein CRENPOLYSF2_3760003 [Crenothrix polyspora]|uniref:Uncharacterized protein n=1 Tax=Crenothrix polyspora TaxID=360316 RepID=A0A1R4HD02_9GAMM|nr:hypothetical protein [Crenothrix polyspora]SJM94104.1 hypothetical protein CRENPOLYSF2_3760003 [Crenothrix polyspora]
MANTSIPQDTSKQKTVIGKQKAANDSVYPAILWFLIGFEMFMVLHPFVKLTDSYILEQ